MVPMVNRDEVNAASVPGRLWGPGVNAWRRVKLPANYGEIGWVLFGQGFVAAAILLNVFVLTKVLSAVQYGVVILGVSLASAVQVLWGSLGNAVNRYYATFAERKTGGDLLGVAMGYAKALALGSALVAMLVIMIEQLVPSKFLNAVALALLLSVGAGYTAMMDGLQNAARKRIVSVLHQCAAQIMRLSLAVAFAFTLARTGMAVLEAFVLSAAVTCLTGTILAKKLVPARWQPDPRTGVATRQLVSAYAWPFVTWGILASVQTISDRWALKFAGRVEEVAIYGAIYQIGYYPIMMLGAAGSQILTPIMFEIAGDGSEPMRVKRAFRLAWSAVWCSLGVTVLCAGAALLFHRAVFQVAFPEKYRAFSFLWPLAVTAGGVFVAGQFAALIPYTMARSNLLIGPFCGAAIIGLILNGFTAFQAGAVGVAIALLVNSTLNLLGAVLVARRVASSVGAHGAHQPEGGSPGLTGISSS